MKHPIITAILVVALTARAQACFDPDHGAMLTHAIQARLPDSARDLGITRATVLVDVSLTASGSVDDARIYKSAGNGAMDREALRAATHSTYSPQLVNCAPVPSHYLFRVEYGGSDSSGITPPIAWPTTTSSPGASGRK